MPFTDHPTSAMRICASIDNLPGKIFTFSTVLNHGFEVLQLNGRINGPFDIYRRSVFRSQPFLAR
jgi:hypothetical protein